jgi:signal transduction histidine kinase
MKVLSSLRSRIFLASSVLAMLCIAVAISLVNARVTGEAERTLVRELVTTGAQVDQLRADRTQTFTLTARLIADLPKLKAAIYTNDPPTLEEVARDYQTQMNASLVLVTNRAGGVLYAAGGSPRAAAIVANQPAIRDALAGRDSLSLLPQPNGIMQVVTVPVTLEEPRHEILGTLSAGFLLDDALAAQLKQVTGSDLAFGMDGQILASTLPHNRRDLLGERLHTTGISRVRLAGQEFEVWPQPLSAVTDEGAPVSGPIALILRSRTDQLKSLEAIRTGLFATAVVAVLMATILSLAVARTIARPLAAITDVMREIAATGDLTRKIALRHRSRWDDEDARLLATTFNTLTDSISRFQREISQKERLAALGRLSTVIAHEVRNPLMIIKASLHALRQGNVAAATVSEVVHDIDEEVARLNRIVNEVLDFARPIQFGLTSVDIHALCRDAAAAARASEQGAEIALDLDPGPSTVISDPERLRIALVNILVNAQQAAVAAGSALHARPVALSARSRGERVTLLVTDHGAGIDSKALAHVFDPYFTTKRGGTGLGLPIAKNIIEGLGGAITVSSAPGHGTEVCIELPIDSTAVAKFTGLQEHPEQ